MAKTLAAKPKLVQISTAYGQQQQGSATLPRNSYAKLLGQEMPAAVRSAAESAQIRDFEELS